MASQTYPKRAKVGDVMTTPVVTATPQDSFKDLVEKLRRHRISAVPVVDAEGRVLGVVSEADLILKEENAAPPMPSLKPAVIDVDGKIAGLTADEVMTAPAMTVVQSTPVAKVAREMHRHGVNRFPVVDDNNKLVGIISRHDVLQIFDRDDADIRVQVLEMIKADPATTGCDLAVKVEDGMVKLVGTVPDARLADELVNAVQSMEGVVACHPNLRVERNGATAATG